MQIEITRLKQQTKDEILDYYARDLFVDQKKGLLNEHIFAAIMIEYLDLATSGSTLYSKGFTISDDVLKNEIVKMLEYLNIQCGLSSKTNKLLDTIKTIAYRQEIELIENMIPFRNGDLYIEKDKLRFVENEYKLTKYRLHVNFNPNPTCGGEMLKKWLNNLFYEEDRKVIQQYLGYCLMPTTKAQKALFLVGDAGMGKSVTGVILNAIWGDSVMNIVDVQSLENDRYMTAELENKLVVYDDDGPNDALKSTGIYKKLITCNIPLTANRKYGRMFKFKPFARIIGCCNEMVVSLYDNTEGFYRRLLPIETRRKPADFIPDPDFENKIRSEIDYIILWCIKGIVDLQKNGYKFKESERSKKFLEMERRQGNPFDEFFEDTFVVTGDEEDYIRTVEIIEAYKRWCRENGEQEKAERSLTTWISRNAERFGIEGRVKKINKVTTRGYLGVRLNDGIELNKDRKVIQLAFTKK